MQLRFRSGKLDRVEKIAIWGCLCLVGNPRRNCGLDLLLLPVEETKLVMQ